MKMKYKKIKCICIFVALSLLATTMTYGNVRTASLSQPTFHPLSTDYFGKNKDNCPIFKVEIDKDDTDRKGKVALTFDSAYYNNCTYKILDELDKHDAKATFFMTTEWMMENPDQVKDILERGHEIGNHTWKHKDLCTLSNEKIMEEVMKGHNYMKETFNIDMSLFRFPYGSYDERTVKAVKNLGYYPIQWFFDSLDWKEEGSKKICDRFDNTDKLVEGAIVLMHNGAKDTPDALPHVFELLEKKGLKSVRVSDLIYKHDFRVSWGYQKKK